MNRLFYFLCAAGAAFVAWVVHQYPDSYLPFIRTLASIGWLIVFCNHMQKVTH